jgi:putative cell wall-binding protein
MRRFLQLVLSLVISFSFIAPSVAADKSNSSQFKGKGYTSDNPILVNFEITAKATAKVGKFVLLKNEKTAISYIESKDVIYRIAKRDKVFFPLTMDYRPNRINLTIKKGKVIGFIVG